MPEKKLPDARLWPDMMSLRRQVLPASDAEKYAVIRVPLST